MDMANQALPEKVAEDEPVVQLIALSKWYGNVIAVNRVTADIQPGITALLGPNGAGKSTLIGMLTGLLRPTQGQVRVFGEPIVDNFAMNKRLGLCHQDDNFYENWSARKFVTFIAKLGGFGTNSKDRAAAMLKQVGLAENAWDRAIKGYSKGMRQRTKLAQALLHEPDILILDEPMTGLDPVGRNEISEMIAEFGESGRSVIVSTHILHEVEAMTDQILVLADGCIRAEGDVHEIRESLENHPYTIKVVCSSARELATVFARESCVNSISIKTGFGDREIVEIRTFKADVIFSMIPQIVAEKGVRIDEISSPDDNLESVFEFLVK